MATPSVITPFYVIPRQGVPDGRRPWAQPRIGRAPRGGPVWARMRDAIGGAWRRHRSRRALAKLSPVLLKDIGITVAEAEHEANKPFWMA